MATNDVVSKKDINNKRSCDESEQTDPNNLDVNSNANLTETLNSDEQPQEPKKIRLSKAEKKEKRRLALLEKRKENRAREKARRKENRRKRVEAGLPARANPIRRYRPEEQTQSSVTVVIDLDFDDYMVDKDIIKIIKQVTNSYAANKKYPIPLKLSLTSLTKRCKDRYNSISGSERWNVEKTEKHYTEVYPKESIVYLSSESENVLTELDDNKVYIIGGLVDHNKHKGLTHGLALKHQINHARLPISEFITMTDRKVLTVNHVYEILLEFANTKSWKEAFFNVIPKRKTAQDGGEKNNSKNKSDSTTIEANDNDETIKNDNNDDDNDNDNESKENDHDNDDNDDSSHSGDEIDDNDDNDDDDEEEEDNGKDK